MNKVYLGCCVFVAFLWNPECESLASGSVYLIQNQGTKQCLAAGPPLTPAINHTKSLFKEGHLLFKTCNNISNFQSTDFSQQWMVRIHKEEPHRLFFQVELIMENLKYNSSDLNATLRGEVLSYFPPLINLKGGGLTGNKTMEVEGFFIIDPATQQCLTAEIGQKPEIGYMKCENSREKGELKNHNQKWSFTLVNEIEFIRYELTQMKNQNKNASSLQSTKKHPSM